MKNPLSDKRKLILNLLRANCRMKNSEIARKTGLPASTVAADIVRIEKILGLRYAALLDYRIIGCSMRAAFIIAADKGVICSLSSHGSVNSISRISEDSNYLVETVFRSMKEMDNFAEDMANSGAEIKRKFHIVEDLKREGFEI